MLLYQLGITTILLVPFGIALRNYGSFAAIRRGERPTRPVRISVLVPARNEEEAIGRCVRSLISQEYPDFEVLVLDDNSEDGTRAILDRLEPESPCLHVLQGAPLPTGWIGKNWACAQLSGKANGELLIFTDADTTHTPESIAACAAFAEREEVELFSGVPRQEMRTFWERIIVPMTQFLYFAYLPNRWITHRSDPRFSATNGQLLCATRAAYDAIGGHEGVRERIVEDIELGRMAKRAGLRIALATAVETVSCRMYRSLGEIVAGFSKNLFPGLGHSIVALLLFILSMLLLYVAPLGFVAAAIVTGRYTLELFWLPLLQLVMAGTIRWMIARRFGMGIDQIIHHPLSALMAVAIAINSARWSLSGAGARWKGRRYERSLS